METPQTDHDWASLIAATVEKIPILDLLSKVSDSPSARAKSLSVDQLAGYIDHTCLAPDATSSQILNLCDEAAKYHFATVCVESKVDRVPQSRKYLRWKNETEASGYLPGVAAVVGFPEGTYSTDTKCAEARGSVTEGATELDMVLNYELLKTGNYTEVYQDIKAIRTTIDEPIPLSFNPDKPTPYESQDEPADKHTTGPGSITLKVILETSQLTHEQIIAGSLIAIRAGADFVKTSTGFRGRGASVDDVKLMKAVCDLEAERDVNGNHKKAKVKASGGIRTIDDCWKMIDAGAERIGASAGVKIVEGLKARTNGASSAATQVTKDLDTTEGTY